MLDLIEGTETELEEEHCGLELRHGPHNWGASEELDIEGARCPGEGLVTISWSELDTFRQCPKKHDIYYIQRWTAEPKDDSPLGKGSLWHRVMETHFNTIKAHQTTNDSGQTVWDCSGDELLEFCLDAVGNTIAVMEIEEERDPAVIQVIKWMYAGYVETYGLDEEWDIIAVENTVIVPLYEADGSESWVRLKVKLDLLVKWKGRYWIIDHKSCGSLPSDKDFDWADQFGLYVYGLGKVGVRVTGTIHNAAKTKMNQGDLIKPGEPGYKKSMKESTLEQRFGRHYMNYTKEQLEEIAADALADGKLAWSEHNHKRRNPDEERCKWRCGASEACMFGRRTGSDANMIDMLQRTGFVQDFTRH